jgi:hypothetical protein
MFGLDQAFIVQSIVHKVGNKGLDEPSTFSADRLDLEEDPSLYDLLFSMNTQAFLKSTEYYRFDHPSSLSLNEVYSFSKAIFSNSEDFIEQSKHITRHLFEQSNLPQIKTGDVLISQLSDILFEGELRQALVLLKIERKSSFFQTTDRGNHIGLQIDKGIDPSKLDKACMIFDMETDEGYRVLSLDFNRYDAAYWKDNFLNITRCDDKHAQTQHFMELCKSFSNRVVKNELGKQEQVNFLTSSIEFMANEEMVSPQKFETEIASQNELQEEFARFREAFEKRKDIHFWDEFELSAEVFNQERKKFKSQIKLDTGIEILVKEGKSEDIKQYLQRFYDEEKGLHYYKVYFNHEL